MICSGCDKDKIHEITKPRPRPCRICNNKLCYNCCDALWLRNTERKRAKNEKI